MPLGEDGGDPLGAVSGGAEREKLRFTTGAVSSSGTSVLASPSLFR